MILKTFQKLLVGKIVLFFKLTFWVFKKMFAYTIPTKIFYPFPPSTNQINVFSSLNMQRIVLVTKHRSLLTVATA